MVLVFSQQLRLCGGMELRFFEVVETAQTFVQLI
jgi:hypothetical protein